MIAFDRIYRADIWQGSAYGSRSGPGSGTAATAHVGPAIVELIERHDIRSVLDVGCGDSAWMPDLPHYVGIDPSREAVRLARERHPERHYLVGDIRKLRLLADLVILRDVVQHLTLKDGVELVKAARAAGNWVLASTYRGGANVGCNERQLLRGWAYDCDLERQPFGLSVPLEVVPDGYAWEGDSVRDERKVLGLWRGTAS
jgi:SAM-dependent methyltransferase